MILGFLVLIVYVYSLNSKGWPRKVVYITFIFFPVDNWSGLIYTFGTRL